MIITAGDEPVVFAAVEAVDESRDLEADSVINVEILCLLLVVVVVVVVFVFIDVVDVVFTVVVVGFARIEALVFSSLVI